MRKMRMVAAAMCLWVAGCASVEPIVDQDVSENGSLLILPAAVSEVNATVMDLVPEWKLVVARERTSPNEGAFDLSTSSSAATVTTSAAGQGSTRVTVYAGTMVTSGGTAGSSTRPSEQSVHAANPRFALDLQRAIVGRLEEKYHVKAVGSADPSLNPLKTGR